MRPVCTRYNLMIATTTTTIQGEIQCALQTEAIDGYAGHSDFIVVTGPSLAPPLWDWHTNYGQSAPPQAESAPADKPAYSTASS